MDVESSRSKQTRMLGCSLEKWHRRAGYNEEEILIRYANCSL